MLVKYGVCDRHCMHALKKHVLPLFDRPRGRASDAGAIVDLVVGLSTAPDGDRPPVTITGVTRAKPGRAVAATAPAIGGGGGGGSAASCCSSAGSTAAALRSGDEPSDGSESDEASASGIDVAGASAAAVVGTASTAGLHAAPTAIAGA